MHSHDMPGERPSSDQRQDQSIRFVAMPNVSPHNPFALDNILPASCVGVTHRIDRCIDGEVTVGVQGRDQLLPSLCGIGNHQSVQKRVQPRCSEVGREVVEVLRGRHVGQPKHGRGEVSEESEEGKHLAAT